MGLETRPLVADGSEAALADSHVESPALDLPPIAAQADDLEAIKKAVDDAASVGGGLWLSYLFVLFYLAVAAGAVTHEDLFFERGSSCRFSTSNCHCSHSSSSPRFCSSLFTPTHSCTSQC